MSDLTPQGALDGRVLDQDGLRITAPARAPRFNLRGEASAIATRIEPLTGLAPPTTPDTLVASTTGRMLWLGPDEWLLEPDPKNGPSAEPLVEALSGPGIALCDVSDGLVAIRLQGPRAAEALTAGTPLDLTARPVGGCAQTRLAQASIILTREAEDTWQLLVRRSMADYLWRWLDAALLRLTPTPV